jgi:hypothetical protein
MAHMHVIPAAQKALVERSGSQASPRQEHNTLSEKSLKQKRAGGVTQVVECLASVLQKKQKQNRRTKKRNTEHTYTQGII